MKKNKYLLLVSSLGVLALLVIAAVQENFLREWRGLQGAAVGDAGPISVQLRQVVNPTLGTADRCVSCHVPMGGEQDVTGPLMVPHRRIVHDPAEYGCTTCHGGQGRATEKDDAHGRVEFWPQPMLPAAMSEAGCGTCHSATNIPHRSALDTARATYTRLDCQACHRVDGVGGTVRPDSHGMEGPDLSRVGVTGWSRGWYESHLSRSSVATRGPWKTSFAAVSDGDRRQLETFLSSRNAAPRLIEAKSVFLSSGCLGCHKVSGAGGDEGPDLTRAGDKDPGRLDFSAVPGNRTLPEWFTAHVRAPSSVVAGSQMPALSVSDDDVEALTFFTLSLRRRDVPGSYLPRDRMRVERFGEREFASDGTTLFGAFCSGCHGPAGQGHRSAGLRPFPAIANPDFLAVASDTLLEQTILLGRPGTRMPAWGDGTRGLRPEDVPVLIGRLRELGGAVAPSDSRPARWVKGDTAAGERLFGATCAGCHGPKGEGGEGVMLNNPVLLDHATDAFFVETIKRGRRGTPMPAFAQASTVYRTLSDAEIEAIVSFIRTWGGKP